MIKKQLWLRGVRTILNNLEIAEKYLKKGSKVYVEGQIQTRKWTDQAGQERYTTEVLLSRFKGELTLLDSRSSNGDDGDFGGGSGGYSAPASQNQNSPSGSSFGGLDDDIPF